MLSGSPEDLLSLVILYFEFCVLPGRIIIGGVLLSASLLRRSDDRITISGQVIALELQARRIICDTWVLCSNSAQATIRNYTVEVRFKAVTIKLNKMTVQGSFHKEIPQRKCHTEIPCRNCNSANKDRALVKGATNAK